MHVCLNDGFISWHRMLDLQTRIQNNRYIHNIIHAKFENTQGVYLCVTAYAQMLKVGDGISLLIF